MTVSEKVCSTCLKLLPAELFSPHNRNSSGLQGYCKPCKNAPRRKPAQPPRPVRTDGLKRCPKCQLTMPTDKFNKNVRRDDGLQSYCKSCMATATRESTRRRLDKTGSRYSPETYQRKLAADRASYRVNPQKQRDYHLKRKYGITIERYQLMHQCQAGLCGICFQPESAVRKVLAVDHHYLTGVVRGLLCQRHNIGIGHFLEDIIMMGNAQIYLASHNNQWKEIEELISMLSEALEASRD